jgi:hypothetical protein
MLEKIIEFTLVEKSLEAVAEKPSPSIKSLPKWYKDMPSFTDKEIEYKDGSVNETLKKCIPVLDSMSNGYIIKTWTDVAFNKEGATWSVVDAPGWTAVEGHDISQIPGYPVTSYYRKEVFKWINPWKIKTPKGYSTLFTTPVGHHLPFKLIDGVVDTDTFPLTINFPFFINSNFSGVIPYGTPMVQLIPFKRDSFKSKIGKFDPVEYRTSKNFHNRIFTNRYKINWWNRKEFK